MQSGARDSTERPVGHAEGLCMPSAAYMRTYDDGQDLTSSASPPRLLSVCVFVQA